MKSLFFLLFIAVLGFSSCKKRPVPAEVPACLNDRIHAFDSTYNCDQSKVDQYIFQNETVYLFDPGVCGWADMTSEVVSQDCRTLGYLGGIAGLRNINGEDFSHATYVKNVWHK